MSTDNSDYDCARVFTMELPVGCLAFALLRQASPIAAQTGRIAGVAIDQGLRVEVNDPRPLATALNQIEKRFAWAITYRSEPRNRQRSGRHLAPRLRGPLDQRRRADRRNVRSR